MVKKNELNHCNIVGIKPSCSVLVQVLSGRIF
jgi:hypothetical protein